MSGFEINEILDYLPHRYPFVLVDRVLDYTVNDSLQAIKNVTINEPFFGGHFPSKPIMPGVLMIEALAQAAGLLALKSVDAPRGMHAVFYLASVDNVRFKTPVVPGDQLQLTVKVLKAKRSIWKFSGEAMVGEQIACSLELMIARG